jgi:hypothetical protein
MKVLGCRPGENRVRPKRYKKVEQAYALNVIILLQAVNRSMSERIDIPFASSSGKPSPNSGTYRPNTQRRFWQVAADIGAGYF